MTNTRIVYLLIAILIFSSCKGTINDVELDGTSSGPGIELILHSDSDNDEKIGMGVAYSLQIINHRASPVEFVGFLNEGRQLQSFFAFTPPNAAHLIAPNGQDLFAVYSQDSSVNEQPTTNSRNDLAIGQFEPLRVEANSEKWQSLYLGKYADLGQPGTYTFWVELEDNFGELNQSNKVHFTLENVESSVPLEFLRFELQLEKDSYTVAELRDITFEYGFENLSDETVLFMRRLYFNLPFQSPVFQLIVRDAKGRMIPIAVSEVPQYTSIDELEYISLQPGKQHYQTDYLPYFPGIKTPGEYSIQLIYTVYENDILSDKPINWGDNVFVGRLQSNEVILTVDE